MCTCGQMSQKESERMCVLHRLFVFSKREVALITGWVVLWIVACPHIRAACKIALTDVLTRRCGGDTGCVTPWLLQEPGHGEGHVTAAALLCPSPPWTCPHRLPSAGQTSTCLFVSNSINSHLNKMAGEIKR